MLFSLSTNCCTADTILRILCREPQRTGDRRTVLERLAHHGDIGVRIGRSSGSHRQELLADILHRRSDVLELFSSFIDTQESCQRLRPSGVFFKTFSNSSTVIPASFAASSIVTRPFLTSLTNIRISPMLMPSSLPSAFTP